MATSFSGHFSAKFLSRAAKRVCKEHHMTPKWFEPLNNGHTTSNPETDDTPRLRVWNSRKEIIITESDLFYAANA